MDRVHTFSKLNKLEARTKYELTVRPLFFRHEGVLEINMSLKRFGVDSPEVTTTLECFDLSLFDDYDDEAAVMLTHILRRLRTPPCFRPRVIRRLLRYGRTVADALRHVDHGRAHMVVDIEIDFGWPLSAVYEYVLERSAAAAAAMVPAAEEAVERMVKRVRVEGGEDRAKKRSRSCGEESCSICLEGMSAPAASMPCSHVFHEDCILRWLKESHYCPLCRFQVPTGTK